MEKNIKYYLALPYTRELIPEPEGGWFVRVKELPGCMSQGETPEEAMEMINEAMELWLETALDHGMAIPEPRLDDDYSGKFVARIPKSLHRKCVECADEDEVSLNQWVVSALSQAVGSANFKKAVPTTTFSDKGYPKWPGLSDAIIHILQDVHYENEAGSLDERCFSGWMEDTLAKVHHCLDKGDCNQALTCMRPLEEILIAYQDRSPTIRLIANLIKHQTQLILQTRELNQRVLVEEKQTAC
jgi:antitoxin HicB